MTTTIRRWLSGLLLLFTPLAVAEIAVHGAWIREMPPVAENTAGYMHIENAAHADRTLVRVDSERFARIEIHETVEDGGMMRMRHRDALLIPAHGAVELMPGGYHLMLMSRRGDPLTAGDRVVLRLVFDDGTTQDVTAEVRRGAPDAHHGHHHRH